LFCIYSSEEAGRYLETYKAFEHKPPDLIMEKIENDYLSKVNLSIFPNFKEHTLTKLYFTQLTHCMTHIRSVNKTDVVTLASTFGVCKLCKLYNVKKLCYIYVDFINI